LLHDPADPNERMMVIFHFLLHCGYLTRDIRGGDYFKIPNYENRYKLKDKIKEYLRSIPIYNLNISELAIALENENFDSFGAQVMDSVHYNSRHYKYVDPKTHEEIPKFRYDPEKDNRENERYPLEGYIHNLLVQTFKSKWEHNDYFYMNEYGFQGGDPKYLILDSLDSPKDPRQSGMRMDFYFIPINGLRKVHVIIELKTESFWRKGMQYNSFLGLKQIFDKNYHRNIMKRKDTEAIINIGMAANSTHCCLSILKTEILKETYYGLDQLKPLKYYGFEIVKGDNNSTTVGRFGQGEENITINNDQVNAAEDDKQVEIINMDVRQIISDKLLQIMTKIDENSKKGNQNKNTQDKNSDDD
jgi:hypothetical protein